MEKITNFRGKYYFLSNFYEAPVEIWNLVFTNNEAAFQSAKLGTVAERGVFVGLLPSDAKKKGRHVRLRKDWEQVKEGIMYDICLAKFTQNKELGKKLLATGDVLLEEGNTWNDREWGKVDGIGKNKLGKALMKVREELKNTNIN